MDELGCVYRFDCWASWCVHCNRVRPVNKATREIPDYLALMESPAQR